MADIDYRILQSCLEEKTEDIGTFDEANDEIDKLVRLLKESKKSVFLGGSGVNASSGIPDFESERDLKFEQILSSTFFTTNTELFFDFYRKHLLYPGALPNACHFALARLEALGLLVSVVTQNTDGLHQKAGSKTVHEIYGSVHRNYCMSCGKFYDADYIYQHDGIPKCCCGGIVKPDVILYDENVDINVLSAAIKDISYADTLIIGGTLLSRYPATELVNYFKGQNLIVINKTSTPIEQRATLIIRDDISEVMGEVVRRMLVNTRDGKYVSDINLF